MIVWDAKRKMAAQALVRHVRRKGEVLISDTTLRDGEQMPGVSLTPEQKLQIAKALEKAGVHSIDAGFAASSEADFEALRLIAREAGDSVVMSLSRAVRSDIDAADRALSGRAPHRRGVSIFVGVSPVHREHKLRKTPQQILGLIQESVAYAAERFQIVAFAPEDASRTEKDFLCECYAAAIDAGATSVAFPDTVGVLTPELAREFIRTIREKVEGLSHALLAVHFHNDLGLALANTLAAISEGVDIAQCTIAGLGERAGNAALEEVALALHLHKEQYQRETKIDLTAISELGKLASDLCGIVPAPTKPILGANIFATEAGVHQDGILKNPETYLPFNPEIVGHGDGIRLVIGKHSGKGALAYRLEKLGLSLSENRTQMLLDRIKNLPHPLAADDDRVLLAMATEVGGL
jgi:2-isopropylmalate synthase